MSCHLVTHNNIKTSCKGLSYLRANIYISNEKKNNNNVAIRIQRELFAIYANYKHRK